MPRRTCGFSPDHAGGSGRRTRLLSGFPLVVPLALLHMLGPAVAISSWHPHRIRAHAEEVDASAPATQDASPVGGGGAASYGYIGHLEPLLNYTCPEDRFLKLGPRPYTGGFNNMLMTLQAGYLLARALNRTLVVPASRNDRYRDFRFREAIDTAALAPVWPCVVDTDKPWGTAPAPAAAAGAGARRLLAPARAPARVPARPPAKAKAKGKGGVKKAKGKGGKTLSPGAQYTQVGWKRTDWTPPPGSIAALPGKRMKVNEWIHTGSTLASLAQQEMETPDMRDAPVLYAGGSAWGGIMTTCFLPEEERLWWSHIRPEAALGAEVAAFLNSSLVAGQPFVGVHLRWLEGKCMNRASDFYVPQISKHVAAMCTNMPKLTAQIARKLAPNVTRVFLASDHQRADADKAFLARGGPMGGGTLAYSQYNKAADSKDKYFGGGTQFVKGRGNGGRRVFEPGLDMFVLAEAELFVGNMISTFSTSVAAWRWANGRRASVLSWPIAPDLASGKKDFFECERAHFWCGKLTKTWSSAGHTKRKGTC